MKRNRREYNMALNFLPTTNYANKQAVWNAIVNAADFWDEVGENSVTAGDITLTYADGTVTATGYGLTETDNIFNANSVMIAASEAGLICTYNTSNAPKGFSAFILSKNSDGTWAFIATTISGTAAGYFLAPNTPTKGMPSINIATASLTCIAAITGTYSTYIPEHAFRVLTAPDTSYTGKMELNG